jgi:hypothetical protein
VDPAVLDALNRRYTDLEQLIIDRAVHDDTYTRNTVSAFALAKLLQEEDMGVSILFMENNQFKQLYASETTYQENGQIIQAIIREICR